MGFGYHAHQQPLGVRVPRPPPEWPRRKSRPLRRPPSDLSVCAHVRKSARASSAHGGPDGPEMGTLPTDFPTQAPDRSHRHSHRNDGGRADRRMSHRASRSALTCASPHARSAQHARTRGGREVVLAVPPLPSRCAPWRAVRVSSVYLKAAHAPRAAGASSRQPHRAHARRRASADVPAVVADVGSCALTCALRTRELHGRCARLPRCTRGDA